MQATLLLRERLTISETAFVGLVRWQVPAPVKGSGYGLKYRLALVSGGAWRLAFLIASKAASFFCSTVCTLTSG
ncbi:MAG: hypothetical protein U5J99_06070 [Parvularculaceae bacterium]|nr:hypothetical protein [Parvularculaceae bacterium]